MAIVKGSNVIGLNVVTIEDGKIIETVDDIAYNPTTQRVEALLVSSGGIFSSAKAIHMDDVRNVGLDAVIVQNVSVMKSVKEQDDSVRSISDSNKFLVKTNILTVDGLELGKVTDIFFDSSTGMVESMEVSQGGLKKLSEGKKSITPADIVTIGADATVVSAYTEAKLEAQGEQGGMKGMVNDIKNNVGETADNLRESTKDALDATAAKSEEIRAAATTKLSEAKDTATVTAERLKRDTDARATDTKQALGELNDDLQQKSDDEDKEVKEKYVKQTIEYKDIGEGRTAHIESGQVAKRTTKK